MSLEDDEFEQDIPGKVWKWEVWPNPYASDCDSLVTDSDERAREAILLAAEMHLWDSNDGEERTLKVVHNKDAKEQP